MTGSWHKKEDPDKPRFQAVWHRGYKTFFVLNSTKHEIFSNKYENAKK